MKKKEKVTTLKQIRIRVEEDLVGQFKKEAKVHKMSLSSYMNFLLNSTAEKEEVLFDEVINKPEKKEVERRVFFTKGEIEILKKYADLNEWNVTREIRYRTISTLAKKPKLNKEELKAIYVVRSAINILGANINRLIRNEQIISDHNIIVCKELAELIQELQTKIKWLIKSSQKSLAWYCYLLVYQQRQWKIPMYYQPWHPFLKTQCQPL